MSAPGHDFYGQGPRRVQELLGTRRLADHIAERYVADRLDDAAAGIVEAADCFYLATANAAGAPDCSYKGGLPGFLKILAPDRLMFPSYDGNGMFRSLGNILENPRVGILIIDYGKPIKLRINGEAQVSQNPEQLQVFPEADAVVHIRTTEVFENCPRYLHEIGQRRHSDYVPRPGHVPPDPEWKLKSEYEGLVRLRNQRPDQVP